VDPVTVGAIVTAAVGAATTIAVWRIRLSMWRDALKNAPAHERAKIITSMRDLIRVRDVQISLFKRKNRSGDDNTS
jgi:uncharacterized protein (DUF697 family)